LSWASNKAFLDGYHVHASETAWIGTEFDYVLDNNGTMDKLYAQVDSIIKNQG
jgi:hypothetical protein